LIDATLASVNICVIARPEIFCISNLVVPPTVGDIVVLERSKVAIVLEIKEIDFLK
jgi:hypothetical protein